MPVAAVPAYLGSAFDTASPGMRFGAYLPIWTSREDQEREVRAASDRRSPEAAELRRVLEQQGMDAAIEHMGRRRRFPGLWNRNDRAAQQAWGQVAKLTRDDQEGVAALVRRQCALAAAAAPGDRVLTIDARSVAPFTTGLGNEHPLENGFAFLWPWGLPYLPGSGVKGVLRQAARELAGLVEDAQWGVDSPWTAEAVTALFGSEDDKAPSRGALQFWDVIPQIRGGRLAVEVMTGHQSEYYMQEKTPHESGQPNPVKFLTVPAGSGFTFQVVCDLPFLRRTSPDLAEPGRWQALLREAFEHAFDWLGFGAKTAVGYGAMAADEQAAEARVEQERQQARARLGPEERRLQEVREVYLREKAAGALSGGCETADQRMQLLREARSWPVELRVRAADLIEEITRDLPWSRKAKKAGTPEQVKALRDE